MRKIRRGYDLPTNRPQDASPRDIGPRDIGPRDAGPREVGNGITITAGIAVPKIDLSRLFDRPRPNQVAVPPSIQTVSLSDGSRISFAAAMPIDTLETA